MNSYNFFLFLLILSLGSTIKRINCSSRAGYEGRASYVSTLTAEGILHGEVVDITSFQYHAVIFGAPNPDEMSSLLCSGAAVSSVWILAPAECFFFEINIIKRLIFKAIVGAKDISMGGGTMQTIEYVYMQKDNNLPINNYIALSRIKNGLPLPRAANPYREGVLVYISERGEKFEGRSGVVSGYGRHKFGNGGDEDGPDTDYKLRYTNVEYSHKRDCVNHFHQMFTYDKFCGVAGYANNLYKKMKEANQLQSALLPHFRFLNRGDFGNPLVIGNKLVGLSLRNRENCDDTDDGSLYIHVGPFFEFIDTVIHGYLNSDIVVWNTKYEHGFSPFPVQK